MQQRPPEKPPANYWAMIASVGSLAVAMAAFLATSNKSNADEVRMLEQRLCRMEAHGRIGECGR